MEILKIIQDRRSVRKYKDKAPSDVEIERILTRLDVEAGCGAVGAVGVE